MLNDVAFNVGLNLKNMNQRGHRVPSDDTVELISAVIQQMTSSFDSSIRIVCVSDYWCFYTHESQSYVTFYLEGSFLKFSLQD